MTYEEDVKRRVSLDCRLAFRTEGPEVVVYMAEAATMEGAIVLARVNRAALRISDTLWDDLRAAFSRWLQAQVAEITGVTPTMVDRIPLEPPEGEA